MGKNKLSDITSRKAAAEESAEREAAAALEGQSPWEGEGKRERVSMRVEPSLKEAYRERLPEFANITDAIRKHMIRVAKGEEDV